MEEAVVSSDHPLWSMVIGAREGSKMKVPVKFVDTVTLEHIFDLHMMTTLEDRGSRPTLQRAWTKTWKQLIKIDALLIIDIRVRVAELLITFMGMKASYGKPIYYVGFCETVAEVQWAEQYLQSKVTQLVGNGETVIPGFTPKPIETLADVLGDPPAPLS